MKELRFEGYGSPSSDPSLAEIMCCTMVKIARGFLGNFLDFRIGLGFGNPAVESEVVILGGGGGFDWFSTLRV